jgi:hypothetical protein
MKVEGVNDLQTPDCRWERLDLVNWGEDGKKRLSGAYLSPSAGVEMVASA